MINLFGVIGSNDIAVVSPALLTKCSLPNVIEPPDTFPIRAFILLESPPSA